MKPLLVLDLDETLICGSKSEPESYDFRVCDYFIQKRPHLNHFIETIKDHYDLAVWSSATSGYVSSVVGKIFPKDTLKFAWNRIQCVQRYDDEWFRYYYVKKLSRLKKFGYDLKKMLIFDNTPKKCEDNYGNAIYARDWTGEKDDEELKKLIKYLIFIKDSDNFRRIEKRGWRTQVESL